MIQSKGTYTVRKKNIVSLVVQQFGIGAVSF